MTEEVNWRRFEALALPHADAAYNLAKWLMRNDHDAQDAVQDAFVRALKYMDTFRGDNARPWLLQVVRNSCFTWLKENHPAGLTSIDDEEGALEIPGPAGDEPHAIAVRQDERARIDAAIAALPFAFREVLVLREFEDLPYKDIARIAEIPIGTVMSRLARARALLRDALAPGARPVLREVPRPTANGRA
ncbi:MAG TPA: sigma-70 family RNA polymerase sigma factor [Caldimonas sp.]|nr:sigma-70 family RNA polymerase sigma factor [Caldimonas sp.]